MQTTAAMTATCLSTRAPGALRQPFRAIRHHALHAQAAPARAQRHPCSHQGPCRCGTTVTRASAVEAPPAQVEDTLKRDFPGAKPASELLQKIHHGLSDHGFTGENTIAITCTCRDEITRPLVQQIEDVFGHPFDIVGLGGCMTCGVTGLKAGLSHAPAQAGGGKDRYVFFALPHVGIQEDGTLGKVRRPGQDAASAACGALVASLGELQTSGLKALQLPDGQHDPDDVEYSILKKRLAQKLSQEGVSDSDIKSWNLAQLTKAAERTITRDLERLISKAVDSSKADYAVVTGVQIHVTTQPTVSGDLRELVDYILPAAGYAVVDGEKRDLFLSNGV